MSSTRVWSKLSVNIGHLLNGAQCFSNFLIYISGLIYNITKATVLTTLSFHLLFARRDADSERAQYAARISILQSLIERLREGERIDGAEVEKLMVLSRKSRRGGEVDNQISEEERRGRVGVTWKEAFLGRKVPKDNAGEPRFPSSCITVFIHPNGIERP
jgi:hypothetical protein